MAIIFFKYRKNIIDYVEKLVEKPIFIKKLIYRKFN